MGLRTYEQEVELLAAVGLRPSKLQKEPKCPAGIGGRATALFTALLPVVLDSSLPGLVETT
eukprot:15466471-Alexandrium_andersonii.AAC.1